VLQIDDDVPMITAPMDLCSEPCAKVGYWFVSIAVTDKNTVPARAAVGTPPLSECLPFNVNRDLVDDFCDDVTLSTLMAYSATSQLHHALLPGMQRALVQLFMDVDTSHCAAELAVVSAHWQHAGMAKYAALDILRTKVGHGALMLVRPLPWPVTLTMRAALHEGVFKMVPTAQELYNGVVRINTLLALDTIAHLVRGVSCLHDNGLTHGEINDATVFVGAVSSGAPLLFGSSIVSWFATLGLCSGATRMHISVQSLVAHRPDYPLFFAPERFSANGELSVNVRTPAADIWSLGMLLAYLLHFSLPLVTCGPLVCAPVACSLLRCSKSWSETRPTLRAHCWAFDPVVTGASVPCPHPASTVHHPSDGRVPLLHILRVHPNND
jgi:hypothetical protein